MIFWLLAALLTAAVVLLLIGPLLRPQAAPAERAPGAVAVYGDQLAELERDRAQGLISEAEAEAARAEIGRRLLAEAAPTGEAAAAPAPSSAAPGRRRWPALALVVLIPAAALALYLPAGRPDLPSQPYATRDPAMRDALQDFAAETEALARRLAEAPEDAAGWVELARRYGEMGRAADAAAAYAQALQRVEGDPEITGDYAAALVAASAGTVTEEARAAFAAVLEARPQDPRARYYLALAREQAGDDEAALAAWRDLAGDAPADAPWLPAVRERIVEVAGRLGQAPDIPEPAPAATPAGPSEADIAAVAAMDEAERRAFIESMVDRLAARLEEAPDDLEGWLRLGQSYRVLGRDDEAVAALARAAALAPEDTGVLTVYADALLAGAADDRLPPPFVEVMRQLLALDDANPQALWFLGMQAVAEDRPDEARDLWQRLLARLEPGSSEHQAVQERIEALAAGG